MRLQAVITCFSLVFYGRALAFSVHATTPRAIPARSPAAADTPSPPSSSAGEAASRVQEAAGLKQELLAALRRPSPPPIPDSSGSKARSQAIDDLLDRLCALNPTPRPGSTAAFAPLAEGTWRVAFAPHIAKLSTLAGVTFDPILYKLDGDGNIESNVRYTQKTPPFGVHDGWLSTRGGYGSRDETETAFVAWQEAWWNPGADAPSANSADGALASFVNTVGRAGFVSAFANFPVRYLDRDLCVFVFPLSNTRIVAVRQDGPFDPWL